MTKVAVVIPIYLKSPKSDEKSSLLQTKKILGKYPIILACPDSLDVSEYQFLTDKAERFDDKNFTSVKAYSSLCLDVNFYRRFEEYDYILICQTDGWVFRDELEEWCEKGYDYIGAPWFEGFDGADSNSKMLTEVGNGGMSLRKVQSHIKLFENPFVIHSFSDISQENHKKKMISNIINFPVNLITFLLQAVVPARFLTKLNEDFYIAKYGKKIVKGFKTPTPEIAMKFAFENMPEKLYEMNDRNLPFMCHAFKKYNFDFWKQFINLEAENE